MRICRCLLSLLFLTLGSAGIARGQDRVAQARTIDSIVEAALRGGRAAGMAVAVVQGKDTVVLKGYGKVDLEWDVATPTDASYEIGSVTKQFTAAAILQLVEQGKLDLSGDISTWLPASLTRGKQIPLRRLLDHTSGIKGYTEMASFGSLAVQKLPRDTLVALVSAEPFDFEPGDGLIYNNTGYFLLGLILEKVTGQPYAQYVKEKLFDVAGMPDSRYCSESTVVGRRAHGYDGSPGGLIRARYLDHTWPYAAGSLCSTVGDMVAWQRALHGGRILGAAGYREMLTTARLNDGTVTRYATGLVPGPVAGHQAISHGGGINGFLSEAVWFPGTDTHIIVLINSTGPVAPARLAEEIAKVLLGPGEPTATMVYPGNLAALAGTYSGVGRGRPLEITILAAGDTLQVRTGTGQPAALSYIGNDTFEVGGRRFTFLTSGGEVRVRADLVSVVSVLRPKN